MRVCGVKYNDLSKVNDDDMKEMMDGEELLYGHISNCKIQRSHNEYDHTSSSIEGQTMLNDWDSFIKFMYDVAIKKKQFGDNKWFEKYQFIYNGDINKMTLEDMKDLINIKCSRLLSQLYSASKTIFDQESIEYNRPCQFMFHGA